MQVHVACDVPSEDLIVSGAARTECSDSLSHVVDLSGGSIGNLRALDSESAHTMDVLESLPQMIPLSYLMATMVVYRETPLFTPVMTMPYGLG